MNCPQCGTQTGEGDVFCQTCGASLMGATGATATAIGPYTKAPVPSRFGAFFADMMIAGALMPLALPLVYAGMVKGTISLPGVILTIIGATWQLFYFLARDGFGGAGFGKRIVRQVVVKSATGAPAGVGASILRQIIMYLVNIVPFIGSLIEPVMVLVDKEGKRLGDKAAKTQVALASEVATRGFSVPAGRGGAIAALSIALAITLLGGAYGAYAFVQAVGDTVTDGDTGIVILDPGESDSEDIARDQSPEDVIDEFYDAVAGGDFDDVVVLFSADLREFADPDMFEAWEVPSYQILESDTTAPGYAYVDVQENDGGFSNGTVTYILVEEEGVWKIDDWQMGGVGDDTSGGAEDPDVDPYASRLDPETATGAVGTLLVALQNDDMSGMRDAASDYFESNNPDYFFPSAGALTNFEILDVFEDGAVYVVIVREDWNSGPEEMTYVVIEEAGIAVVDDVYYE